MYYSCPQHLQHWKTGCGLGMRLGMYYTYMKDCGVTLSMIREWRVGMVWKKMAADTNVWQVWTLVLTLQAHCRVEISLTVIHEYCLQGTTGLMSLQTVLKYQTSEWRSPNFFQLSFFLSSARLVPWWSKPLQWFTRKSYIFCGVFHPHLRIE